MPDLFMFRMLVEGVLGIADTVLFTLLLLIVWRALRSDWFEDKPGVSRIGTGIGLLGLSMVLPVLLGIVDLAFVLETEQIPELWYVLVSAIPVFVAAFYVLTGARRIWREAVLAEHKDVV